MLKSSIFIRHENINKFFQFLAVGFPAFLIAIFLNYILVDYFLLHKWLAYALVLLVQITINFFACIFFVFKRDQDKKLINQFFIFMSGVSVVRVIDWLVYLVLTGFFGFYYIAVQIFNVIIFSVIKFNFTRRTIEG